MFGIMRPASLKSMLSSRLSRADILITINQYKVSEEHLRVLKSGGVGRSPFEKAQQRFGGRLVRGKKLWKPGASWASCH